MYKKILSFLLALSLCVSMSVFQINSVSVGTVSQENKITQELQKCLSQTRGDSLIPVYIWIDDIHYENIESQILQKTGFSELSLLQKSSEVLKQIDTNSISNIKESVYNGNYNIENWNEWSELLENTQEARKALSKTLKCILLQNVNCHEKHITQKIKNLYLTT